MAKTRTRSLENEEPPPDAFDLIAQRTGRSRAEVMDAFQERAAIRQYLGDLPRVEAEIRAIADTEAILMGA